MGEWVSGQVDGWMSVSTDGYMMDGWRDGWMMDGWMEGWMEVSDGCLEFSPWPNHFPLVEPIWTKVCGL